jgi:hypothetical protein
MPAFGDTWVRTAAPVPANDPPTQRVCPSGSGAFPLQVIGNGPFVYRWQVEDSLGSWQDLTDGNIDVEGPTGPYLVLSGAGTNALVVTKMFRSDHPVPGGALFRCRVSNSCGTISTAPARFITCVADYDCSGELSVQDIFAYLNAWFAGASSADFNGGGLSVQDIFDFLNAWFAGC